MNEGFLYAVVHYTTVSLEWIRNHRSQKETLVIVSAPYTDWNRCVKDQGKVSSLSMSNQVLESVSVCPQMVFSVTIVFERVDSVSGVREYLELCQDI